jgi:hypothetical protein
LRNSWGIRGARRLKLLFIRGAVSRQPWRAAMKSIESLPSEAALRRLVLARVAAGFIVVVAIILAPPVTDSIATLNLTASELAAQMDDSGAPIAAKGVDVDETTAAPLEPLSTSY